MSFPNQAHYGAQGEVTSAVDWLGNRFQIGDLVVYCISAGRGQMMAFGRVQALRVKEGAKTTYVRENGVGNYKPLPPDEWVIEVQVLTEKTSGHWDNGKRTRPAWVNEMNITAVNGFESAMKTNSIAEVKFEGN